MLAPPYGNLKRSAVLLCYRAEQPMKNHIAFFIAVFCLTRISFAISPKQKASAHQQQMKLRYLHLNGTTLKPRKEGNRKQMLSTASLNCDRGW